MKESLKALVSASLRSSALKDGFLSDTEEGMKWLPILKCSQAEYHMGILEDGHWAVEAADGLHRLSDPRLFVYVIDLLEQPINSIHEQIAESFKSLNISAYVDDVFPFIYIIKAGLEQGSEYWAGLAFEWFEHLSDEKKRSLSEPMAHVIDAKWASQKLRQKAKKALKQMRVIKVEVGSSFD